VRLFSLPSSLPLLSLLSLLSLVSLLFLVAAAAGVDVLFKDVTEFL